METGQRGGRKGDGKALREFAQPGGGHHAQVLQLHHAPQFVQDGGIGEADVQSLKTCQVPHSRLAWEVPIVNSEEPAGTHPKSEFVEPPTLWHSYMLLSFPAAAESEVPSVVALLKKQMPGSAASVAT